MDTDDARYLDDPVSGPFRPVIHPGSTEVTISRIPLCDIDPAHGAAAYDGRMRQGSWAYMCEPCFERYGTGLGTGYGQRLIPASAPPAPSQSWETDRYGTRHPLATGEDGAYL
jgi:hypothetical protein